MKLTSQYKTSFLDPRRERALPPLGLHQMSKFKVPGDTLNENSMFSAQPSASKNKRALMKAVPYIIVALVCGAITLNIYILISMIFY